jgi:hypothetical protein
MKSRSFHHFAFLHLISLFLISSQANGQWMARSYYSLIKDAADILIIKVNRIAGEPYGEKAVAHVERSYKKNVHSDSIELPFVYSSWPTGKKNEMASVSEIIPVSFEDGKRYVVLVRKSRQTFYDNPHAAKTEYEVVNYPNATYFKINDDKDSRVLRIEQLLKTADENDAEAKSDSLLAMIHSNDNGKRNDAIEALIDLKSEKATDAFIAVLRNDPDSTVRYTAARGLGYLHSDSIVSVLMESLQKEKVNFVKYQIIVSLGERRAKIAAPMLLKLYETELYDNRNAILETISALGDSTVVPSLIHLFSIDQDLQHRRLMAQTISSFHTLEADEFSSALLDTAKTYWLKSAVIYGWSRSTYTKGFDKIARWTSIPCASDDHPSKVMAEIQGLAFPLLRAIEKLGKPDQIASTLKVYSTCSDPAIRDMAVRILKEQMAKNITTELRKEIDVEIKTFPTQ